MNATTNPYEAPIVNPAHERDACRAITQPVRFRGSMSVEEFYEVHRAKQRLTSRAGKLMACCFCVAVAVGGLAFSGYTILFEGFEDHFVSTLLGIGIVCALPLIVYAERFVERKKLDALKAKETGVFSPVRGEVSNTGVFAVASGDWQAIDTGWDMFCGYRDRGDAIVVFTRFPGDYVALVASWFGNPGEWKSVKQLIQSKLAPIPWSANTVDRQAELLATPMGGAMQHFAQGEWHAAISAFDEILASTPNNVLALRRRAKAVMASEPDPSKVLPAVQAAIEQGAEDTVILRMRAQMFLACEDYESALADHEELVRRDPDDFDSLRNRGLALLKVGEFRRAIKDCSQVIHRYPEDAVAYNNRGVARLELGDFDKAMVDFEKAISLEPSFPNPQQHLERAIKLLAEDSSLSVNENPTTKPSTAPVRN